MAEPNSCADHLRRLILKADRADIGSAQKAMLEYAMAEPSAGRVIAVDELLGDLVAWQERTSLSPLQHAFSTVTVAMIERTRMVVGPHA